MVYACLQNHVPSALCQKSPATPSRFRRPIRQQLVAVHTWNRGPGTDQQVVVPPGKAEACKALVAEPQANHGESYLPSGDAHPSNVRFV